LFCIGMASAFRQKIPGEFFLESPDATY
jgi:hypothetical protein